MKYKNLFYFAEINKIGGVETFYYYLAKKYKDRDIVIVYKVGDEKQIARLRQYVRVIQFNGQRFSCEKAFFNYTIDIIDYIDAEEYIYVAHGDYKAIGIMPNYNPKLTGYVGVSKQVCTTFKEITGRDIELSYNPICVERPQKMLRLISATRLTVEKGKKRIEALANLLDKKGILYTWEIFTDDANLIRNDSIVYRKPRLDIIRFIASADYLVQLSDHEGYCYSVVEALSVGTPVIVTDCPVFRELGIESGKNGFILPHDMSDVPIDAILKGLPKFEYKTKADNWSKILAKGESQYQKDLVNRVSVVCTRPYHDIEYGRLMNVGETYDKTVIKSEELVDAGVAILKERR